jgi:hypothetical protein
MIREEKSREYDFKRRWLDSAGKRKAPVAWCARTYKLCILFHITGSVI